MRNLLIVDDELFVADGLVALFTEQMSDVLDVYCAYNGKQALEKMAKIRMDIVLCDIKMPDITGLELQKQTMKKWPFCKYIFLTAYEDFNYIKSAIRNNAVDYLLKTEGDEEILKAVNKTLEMIETEEKNQQLLIKAKNDMSKAASMLKNDFLSNLINGYKYSFAELQQRFDYLGINLSVNSPVMIVVSRMDIEIDIADIENNYYDLCNIEAILEKYITARAGFISFINKQSELICLIQPNDLIKNPHLTDKKIWEELYVFVTGMLEKAQSTARELLGKTVSFILSREPFNWGGNCRCIPKTGRYI